MDKYWINRLLMFIPNTFIDIFNILIYFKNKGLQKIALFHFNCETS